MGSTGNDIFDPVTMHSPLVHARASTASEQHIEPMGSSRCCQGQPRSSNRRRTPRHACASYRVTSGMGSASRSAILKKNLKFKPILIIVRACRRHYFLILPTQASSPPNRSQMRSLVCLVQAVRQLLKYASDTWREPLL